MLLHFHSQQAFGVGGVEEMGGDREEASMPLNHTSLIFYVGKQDT